LPALPVTDIKDAEETISYTTSVKNKKS